MKTVINSIGSAVALIALTCGAFSTAFGLIIYPINNGFEEPDLGSGCFAYQYSPTSPGWIFYGGGIAANESCFDVAGATNGNSDNGFTSTSGQAALLQGGDGTLAGGFSQTLTIPDGNWSLLFRLEGRPFYDGPNGVNVFLDGVQVGSTLFPDNLGSFNNTGVDLGHITAGSHTIGFAGTVPFGDHTTFVDNVRVTNNASIDLFASVNGFPGRPDILGSIYEYAPNRTQCTYGYTISLPRGIAFDSVGNLFVASNVCEDTCQATIFKITPAGVQTLFGTVAGDFFFEGLAVDQSDNVFAQTTAGVIYKFTSGGVQSVFGSVPTVQSLGITFDNAGNLYTPVNFQAAPPQIWKFTPNGTSSVFATESPPYIGFNDLAFDRFGNLFVSSGFAQGEASIVKFVPDGTQSTFATGLYAARGLAFDRAGNLFVAEIIPDGPGDILKFTPGGHKSIFASGIGRLSGNGGPEFLAFRRRPRPPRSTTGVTSQR